MNSECLVELRNLSVGVRNKLLLKSFSLTLNSGNFLTIVGSNGSGKTTLLRTILGFLKPLSGNVTTKAGLRFGYVPQRAKTQMHFPLTVEQVVMLGRTQLIGLFKSSGAKDRAKVHEALEELGILNLANKRIGTLSGGQYQRTLVARALASEPHIMIFDEPTAGMDLVAQHQFLQLISRIKNHHKLTAIMVTHDLASAAEFADLLLIINSSDRSVSVGSPAQVLKPEILSQLFHLPISVKQTDDRYFFTVDT